MLGLVGDDVPSIEGFMTRYRVRIAFDRELGYAKTFVRWITLLAYTASGLVFLQRSSTRVRPGPKPASGWPKPRRFVVLSLNELWPCSVLTSYSELHHVHGCPQAAHSCERPATSTPSRPRDWICPIQRLEGVGRSIEDGQLVWPGLPSSYRSLVPDHATPG
jgi:hypothetical protein